MKKYLFACLLTSALLHAAWCAAAEIKVITLTSGSTLKGEVVALQDGVYTIDAVDLGRMYIPEDKILSISSPAQASVAGGQKTTKQQVQEQVNKYQKDILTDPGLMSDLESTLQDEEVQKMISDPKLLDAVLTYDPEKIQQSDAVQELIQNEKMQELMLKIQQKISSGGN